MFKQSQCPFGSRKCDQCQLWLGFPMEDIQTGEVETKYDCSINWQARFAREQVIKTIGVQQATESFRNEMVKGQEATAKAVAGMLKLQLINER